MKITWLGHACMLLCEGGFSVVCDPYSPGSVPGFELGAIAADRVLCSHGHRDHCCREAVTLRESGGRPFEAAGIPSWHDDRGGALRGANTIHVITAPSGIRAVHMGDIGCMLTEEQAAAIGSPDVLMLPVGGFYTVDARGAMEIVKRLRPRVVLPMHFRGDGFGYDVLGTAEDFTALFEPGLVRRYAGASIEVDAETEPQIALLTYRAP